MLAKRCLVGLFGILLVGTAFAQDPTDRAGWTKKIETALEEGKDKEALTYLGQAAKAFPDETSFRRPGQWFEEHGEKRIKEKGYEAGFAVAERALKVLPANEQTSILVWRSTLYRFWSQDLLRKKDLDGSLKVLANGYALLPNDPHIHAGIAFHAQEALAIAEGKSVDAVIEQYKALIKQFPKVEADISERGQRLAELAVSKLVDKMKFKEAVEAVDRYGPLLPKAEQRAKAGGIAYDGWALHLADKKEWDPALAKYAEGLKAYPGHARLLNNALIIVERWAEPAIDGKNWDEAIRIYGVALKYFPDNSELKDNKRRYEKWKAEEK